MSGIQPLTETTSRHFGKKYRIQVSRERTPRGIYPHRFFPWHNTLFRWIQLFD